MKIHEIGVAPLPSFHRAVITIGSFDGVHTGHRKILAQMKEVANQIGGETVIITFYPHPRKVIASIPGEVKILNTVREKWELLAAAGIDHLVVIPFNHSFAQSSAEDFVEQFLFKQFHPHTVIIGYDHRFGKNRSGDYHLLETMGQQLGFQVQEISEQMLQESAISSTRIRQALLQHKIQAANELLGYPYFFEGKVIEGNQRGRTLGYPTANLQITDDDKLIPGNGVYVVYTLIDNPDHQAARAERSGMMNIGIRPTIDGKSRVIEVHLFNWSQSIYGQTIRVQLLDFIREEQKFISPEVLREQLQRDESYARNWLQQHKIGIKS
jgi:riboflavin kinase/FMN adenylyltransferase